MKTNPFAILHTSMAAALVLPALAIEAPQDNAPPPAAVEQPADVQPMPQFDPQPEARPVEPDEQKPATAYLGVVSSEVPEMLAEHLQLKPGEGIIVRSVLPDGPAAKAGITENDIIIRIDGEAVGSSQDLTREVKGHHPGKNIKLDVIQKGKPGNVEVTLGTRPDHIANFNIKPLDDLNFDGIPRELADRVRGVIEGNLGGFELELPDENNPGDKVVPQMEEAMKGIQLRLKNAFGGLNGQPGFELQGGAGIPDINVQQGATIRMLDEKGSIELMSNDGSKEVTIRDKENNITWTGPWDTEQDKAAAPDDVRQRVERLRIDPEFKGNGLRLEMRGGQLNLNQE